jgi:D-3-phosphoglycerate dehydrogenase / 2-oxoglutarate reductase
MPIKVVVTDFIEPDLVRESEELGSMGIDFAFHQLKFQSPEAVIEATRVADVVVVNMVPITEQVIKGWTRCKLVIRHGTGYDNVDTKSLTEAGIPLCYIPDYCTEEVAEQAISLIMACGRRLQRSIKVLKDSSLRGEWDFSEITPIYRMAGRTLGILGCGRIGSRVYLKLKSFGFRFLICDPYLTEVRKQELEIETVDKEQLFRESDFISIHTLLTPETRNIVNRESLALMKPTAFVINTARGPLLDPLALAEAIQSGKLAGAAIDVYGKEPPEPAYPLFGLPDVILTPHISWYSEDSGWRIREIILLEIQRFTQGLAPRYVVNPEVLPTERRD